MQAGLVRFSSWEGVVAATKATASFEGEEESYPFLPLVFISLINVMGVFGGWLTDTIKELMSYPKYRSVKVINNPAKSGSNHKEVNYINYKEQQQQQQQQQG